MACKHKELCPKLASRWCNNESVQKKCVHYLTLEVESLQNQLAESQRRERAVEEDLKKSDGALTLDELKQMDGESIWVVTLDGTDEPRWEIIVSAGKQGIDLIYVLNGVETMDYASFDLYGDTWLAYDNPV